MSDMDLCRLSSAPRRRCVMFVDAGNHLVVVG